MINAKLRPLYLRGKTPNPQIRSEHFDEEKNALSLPEWLSNLLHGAESFLAS